MHRNLAWVVVGWVEELSVIYVCKVSMLSKYYKVSFTSSKCGRVHFTGIL